METQQDDAIYNAEEILKERVKNGKNEYLIKWKSWSIRHSTWEPPENLIDPRLMSHFRQKQNTNTSDVHAVQPEERSTSEKKTCDSTIVPKEVIGQNKFWQQEPMLELFNAAYTGEISLDSLKSTINESSSLITLHYKDYVKRKTHVQKLKEKDTFSLPRFKQTCSYQCSSCYRNYLTKETLRNHLIFHVKNIKKFKRNKYSTDRDYLAVDQLKMLNLQPIPNYRSSTGQVQSKATSKSNYKYNSHSHEARNTFGTSNNPTSRNVGDKGDASGRGITDYSKGAASEHIISVKNSENGRGVKLINHPNRRYVDPQSSRSVLPMGKGVPMSEMPHFGQAVPNAFGGTTANASQ